MPETKLPWDIFPELMRDRLIILAQIFLAIRERCVKAMLPLKGENGIVLGQRCYQWTRWQTADEASARGVSHWLYAEPVEPMQFELRIGSVRMHYLRGDAADPPERSIASGMDKFCQPSLFDVPGGTIEDDELWMPCVAINTDKKGHGIGAEFFEVSNKLDSDGNRVVRNVWTIPVDEKIETGGTVLTLVRGGTDIPPPAVTPKRKPRRKSGSDDEKGK